MIRALKEQKTNALLESPTGSGKSLALLCGALSWLEYTKDQRRAQLAALAEAKQKEEKLPKSPVKKKSKSIEIKFFEDDDDFIQEEPKESTQNVEPELEQSQEIESSQIMSIPKIYFCSRTHKQISQIVDQLRKTGYHPKMSILGSRNLFCVNPKVQSAPDRNKAWF